MKLSEYPLTALVPAISLDSLRRSVISGTDPLVLTDAGGHVGGTTVILIPTGTAPTLAVPWVLDGDAFDTGSDCLLRLKSVGGRVSAHLRAMVSGGGFTFDFDFEVDGPLDGGITTFNPLSSFITPVEQDGGRYQADVVDNTADATLWFHSDQGRLDYVVVNTPFVAEWTNVGTGTVADSQVDPSTGGGEFLLCAAMVHADNGGVPTTLANYEFMAVGVRAGSLRIEGKRTVDDLSDLNFISVLAARVDIRVTGTAGGALTWEWREVGDTVWILYNGTGNPPGPAPDLTGGTVLVGIAPYAAGTAGIPFTATCDRFTVLET